MNKALKLDIDIFSNLLQRTVFQLLVFLIPSQLAFHLWPQWAHVFGIRVDYLSPSLYLTDVLIGLLLLLWLIDLVFSDQLRKTLSRVTKRKNIFVIGCIFIFALLNIAFAQVPMLALVKWLKVFELTLLALFIVFSRQFKFLSWFLTPFVFSVLFFSLLGLIQFVFQRTIGGVLYFLGERVFTAGTPGIALVSIYGRQYLRAYSTFPHPNALGGFLLFSIILLIKYFDKVRKNRLALLSGLALVSASVALIFTFSKSAWIGGVLVLVSWIVFKIKPKGVDKLFGFALLILIVLSLAFPLVSSHFLGSKVILPQNIFQRIVLADVAGRAVAERPWLGVGLNLYIIQIPEKSISSQVFWWLQPVHNIFLLILVETGLIGLLAVFIFLFKTVVTAFKKERHYLVALLLVVFVTGLVDHYWLTLQQNQILAVFILAFIYRKNV